MSFFTVYEFHFIAMYSTCVIYKSKPLLNRFIVSQKIKKIYCIISQNYIHHLIEEYLKMIFWNLKLNYWKRKVFNFAKILPNDFLYI